MRLKKIKKAGHYGHTGTLAAKSVYENRFGGRGDEGGQDVLKI